MIHYGKINVIAGFTAMLLAAMGGFALGATFDTNVVKDEQYILSIVRFYLREGHSHGMPIAMYNMIVGLWIDKVALSNRSKLIASWAAVCGLLLPVGLALKGAAGAPANFPPVGLPGILGMFTSIILLLIGAIRIQRNA
ncbi:hypothetical protein IQB76_01415 [Leptospira borgpetersenii serovar Hardjo-bovis]|uniref:Uncharacterized protein n=1 Tax=Leptospira borgpetersenii serovar Hardjo-bovis str. Sponselee TaxID=1303729 RepID=M6BNA6_LEPBO|nr:hypothetical protein [Leptospira borgpetersenii]ABJ80148.1 Hypothetical protein LBL_2816 [Leptospira borgpetersenii serovar Hardjo-bovis str. L550]AMX59609.1 hypothetical protein LBK6_15160 [Leptospira borgpetersenii serovar Hardjo]AMX62837.1 hypothetical protein LBK9_15080 [Leptospira borgpetersenii serovar Hardjo]AMX66080.1 hypothetical protein LBK30_15085 [Leptospira borgpetersenii serovar Hardjo]AMX69312.1 hypothetical protein LBHA_15045 [Leptospira borgpetersenii serovar Hardjo]